MGEREKRLVIGQTGETFSVRYGDGTQTAFETNGKKQVVETRRGEVEVKARWKGERLVVKSKVEGRKRTETYELEDGGKLLRVLVEMKGPRGKIELTRVYRPAADAGG